MTYKEIIQERTAALEKLLHKELDEQLCGMVFVVDVHRIAQRLAENNVNVEKTAMWIRDESYQGKSKVLYRCSHCDHWKTVKKDKQEDIVHFHYCNFCGSKMSL